MTNLAIFGRESCDYDRFFFLKQRFEQRLEKLKNTLKIELQRAKSERRKDVMKTLVKDAEGDIVHIVPHPDDQAMVEEALRLGAGTVYLTKVPRGVWVRMEKYGGAPFTKLLQGHSSTLLPADTRSLVFIEPHTADPFIFREYTVTRTGLGVHLGGRLPEVGQARGSFWFKSRFQPFS